MAHPVYKTVLLLRTMYLSISDHRVKQEYYGAGKDI